MKLFIYLLFLVSIVGCSTHKPIKTADYVDLNRFMGKWYVIANIPTFIEKGAHNAVETYEKNLDGSIATTFYFNKDSFDGELVTYHPVGTVVDKDSNAVWEMQFVWPFKADYRIVHVDEDYQVTIIGRNKRDYVWLMAREPSISEADFNALMDIIHNQGYDKKEIQRVPHKPQPKDMAWRT